MPLFRSLLALLLAVSLCRSAELRTLRGEAMTGQLVSVNEKEVVFAKSSGQVTLPVGQVLHVELGQAEKIPGETVYIDVELNDSTLLHCSACRFKGKNLVMTLLLTGQKVEVPIDAVNNMLNNAQNEKYRKEWTERVKKRVKTSVLARLRDGVVNPLPGVLGDGNEDGTKIQFTPEGRTEPLLVPLTNAHGLIFRRDLDPNVKPPLCKVLDTFHDVVMVAGVSQDAQGITFTTPAGAKLTYPLNKLALLDYSNGKIAFLSDLKPDRLVETSTEDRIDHYKRDQNMDGNTPIKIKGDPYTKGLSIHAYTRMDFDLNGEFTIFKAVAGFDDTVGGHPGPVILRIEGDGKELYSKTFDRSKPTVDKIALTIKDVTTLRIEVSSNDLLTMGKHLVLADAKVSK